MTIIKGNLKSEQLLKDGSVVLDYDSPVRGKWKIEKILKDSLGEDNVSLVTIAGNEVYLYTNSSNEKIVLLCKAITYMGGNGKKTKHPEYLNRIQMPKKWKEISDELMNQYDVRFIGIYHYKELIIFTDVVKDSYIKNKMNNSSAHIYMGDLSKALKKGVFKRVDRNDNILKSVAQSKFKHYLDNNIIESTDEFEIFKEFNKEVMNGQWMIAIDAIKEMKENSFRHWRQGEWPGWSLEYRFNRFLVNNKNNEVIYAGNSRDFNFIYDFDLWVKDPGFYADLKSSDIDKKEVPGNHIDSVKKAIMDHGKLWYVVYEHSTKKDKLFAHEQTIKRNELIKESGAPKGKHYNELSYGGRMKNSVKYESMFILELDQNNYLHYIDVFNQGKQQDGSARNPKIKFSKHQIENAVVFSYSTIY